MKLKTRSIIGIILFIVILFNCNTIFAKKVEVSNAPYTKEYERWLSLSEEEREDEMRPQIYIIPEAQTKYNNPLRVTRLVGSSLNNKYSLVDDIPENVIVRDQEETELCWAFVSLSSLETNLALSNLKNHKETKVYDYSEKHMDYATVNTFYDVDDIVIRTNVYGLNRAVASKAGVGDAISYLTNGMGAVSETKVPFDYTDEDLDDIFSHKAETTVKDMIQFPSYTPDNENIAKLQEQMKEHIMNYGSLGAYVYAPDIIVSEVYNNATGAMYCNDETKYPYDHSVSIIGWDDNYSKENFVEGVRPQKDGAWIVKNSWGEKKFVYTVDEVKEELFNVLSQEEPEVIEQWASYEEISDEFINSAIQELGYIREGDNVYVQVGKNGFMYISYEDVNIYKVLFGITKATDKVDYENIYQYNETSNDGRLIVDKSNKVIIANKFDKQTEGEEYISEVGIYAPETYTCKVLVNTASGDLDNLQPVALKAGETEKISAGYHTLELAEPLKIDSDSTFVIAVEATGEFENIWVATESKIKNADNEVYEEYQNIKLETGKCFIKTEGEEWTDISTIGDGEEVNVGDSSIKAFTISNEPDNSLDRIEVSTPPNKTSGYYEGDSFDPEGMVVTAYYNNGEENEVTEYEIDGGESLEAGNNVINIKYNGETAVIVIYAEAKPISGIEITKAPNKTEYFAGEAFDPEGMEVTLTYEDGEEKLLTDYTYEDVSMLEALEFGQDTIVVKYGEFTAEQPIVVKQAEKSIEKIRIKTQPKKTEYIEGQDFDSTDMVVVVKYKGEEEEVELKPEEYTITNNKNLIAGPQTVTITYQGFKAEQAITVYKNEIIGIEIKSNPTKMEYNEGEKFNPDGMVIEAEYRDGSKAPIEDYEILNEDDLQELEAGSISVIIKYNDFEQSFKITVNEVLVEDEVVDIIIKTAPKKTEYKLYEDFDPEGMKVVAILKSGQEMQLTEEDYEIVDGDTLLEEQDTVTISYKQFEAKQKITVKKAVQPDTNPVGSDFSNAKEKTKMIKGYYYRNTEGQDHVLMEIEISNINKGEGNDKYEYYYYLSGKASANNIDSWIKISGAEIKNGVLSFTADTRDMTNLSEIESASNLYIYIKEVATKGDEKVQTVSKGLTVEADNVPFETYTDGKLDKEYEDISTQKEKEKTQAEDKTVADRVFPNTGSKIAFALVVVMIVITTVRYVKYRKLREIK